MIYNKVIYRFPKVKFGMRFWGRRVVESACHQAIIALSSCRIVMVEKVINFRGLTFLLKIKKNTIKWHKRSLDLQPEQRYAARNRKIYREKKEEETIKGIKLSSQKFIRTLFRQTEKYNYLGLLEADSMKKIKWKKE